MRRSGNFCLRLFCLFALCILNTGYLRAQNTEVLNNDFRFKRFGPKDGFALSTASSIIEDRYGYVWIGSGDGLYRYDGYAFKTYKYDPADSTTISGNIVNCLLEDHHSNIWVGTANGGLCYYNRKTDKFIRLTELYWKKEMYKIQSISAIMEDRNGNIWFGNSMFQFFLVNPVTLEIIPLKYDIDEKPDDLFQITSIYEDKNATVWLGTHNGLYYSVSNYKTSKTEILAEKIYKKIPNIFIEKIIPNPSGSDSVYLCLSKGRILSFNIHTGAYKELRNQLISAVSNAGSGVTDVILDRKGNWWIATRREGVFIYNDTLQQVINLKNDQFNPNSISFNATTCILHDSHDRIWITTDGGGVCLLNNQISNFYFFRQNPLDKKSLASEDIWAIYADEDGIILGSMGLMMTIDKNGEITSYGTRENPVMKPGSGYVSSIQKAPDGSLWISTEGLGILKINKKARRLEPLEIKDDFKGKLAKANVTSFCFESDSIIWIATNMDGLFRYSRLTKNYQRFIHRADDSTIGQNAIMHLFMDSRHRLWIGLADNGLDCMNPADFSIRHFNTTSQNSRLRLSSDVILFINEDSYGNIWTASERGLNVISPDANNVFSFNNIPTGTLDIVYAVLEDNGKNMWLSTNKGLFRFSIPYKLFNDKVKSLEHINASLVNYDENDGLPSNEFNQGSTFKDAKGQIYFGSVSGLVYFNPAMINSPSFKPRININNFRVFDREVQLDSVIEDKKRIVLSHAQNYFSFDFVSPGVTNQNKVKYRYILEGFQPEWRSKPNLRSASFTNVNPGIYQFKVQVTDLNGNWHPDIRRITIVINPPFWKTGWFYILVSIVLFISIYTFIRIRERNLIKENKLLEEKVRLRTADVLKQKDQLEQKGKELESALHKVNENINFSLKIQQSILPSLSIIKEVFPETFIFFKPRNVVSGDFYFFHLLKSPSGKSKLAVFAVADATGHGVPGAFMSMIGSTLLNEIVNLKGILKPNHILDELKLGVRETLKQNTDEHHNSLDMAVCTFDLEAKNIEFAGARLPLIIFREGKLLEVKPDKMRIGGYGADAYDLFTDNKLKLQKGDMIYCFTDGFYNQFGGEKHRKFKYKRFREMLHAIHTMSFVDQNKQLDRIFNDWKGNEEQVDDILLVGIKF